MFYIYLSYMLELLSIQSNLSLCALPQQNGRYSLQKVVDFSQQRTLGFRKRILTREGSTCTLLKGHFLGIWLQTKIGLLKRSFIGEDDRSQTVITENLLLSTLGVSLYVSGKCSTFFFKWTWKQMTIMEAICRYDVGAKRKGWQGDDLL